MMAPVPFLQLFKYASSEDLVLLGVANLFIIYSSLNIPLVNIVYGLMMREMNDYVARRALFTGTTALTTSSLSSSLSSSSSSSISSVFNSQLDSYSINNYTDTFAPSSASSSSSGSSSLQSKTALSSNNPLFNGTFEDAQTVFMENSYNLCMIVILFGVTRFLALYLALLFFSIAASNQAKRVKLLFFKSLLRQEISWFEQNRTGDFAIRITSDLSKFEDGIGEKIALCLNALFAWMSSLISSFYYGWELTLVCLVLVPLTVFITTLIAEFQASYSIKESSALSRAFNVCHEVISSIRTVLAFSGEKKEAERFKIGLDSAYKYGLKRNMFAGLNLGFTWMSGYLGFAICLLYSTKFYSPENYGAYDEAHIITILWSAAGCVFLLNRMMPFIEIIQMARGSASNLFSVIERKSKIDVTSESGLKPRLLEANVRFENVYFTYPSSSSSNDSSSSSPSSSKNSSNSNSTSDTKAPDTCKDQVQVKFAPATYKGSCDNNKTRSGSAGSSSFAESTTTSQSAGDSCAGDSGRNSLDSGLIHSTSGHRSTISAMSMEVKSGQTIALVGPSGSGKSTALALMQRFYELDEGSITLGGHNLRDLNLAWLRSQFGVVTQEPVLFDMSIADNIRLGARPDQTVSDYDIEQAARSANAHSFIVQLPAGYETRAGARGLQLSGGQKQRIAIARALVRQPKILLLDEATSALDLESEAIVQKALDQARIGRTTFIVAHRLSTVRNADRIIVFDRGTIVETGSHEELLQLRGLYHQISAQQRQGVDNQLAPSIPLGLSGGGGGGGGGLSGLLGTSRRGSSGIPVPLEGPTCHTRECRSLSIYSTGKYATTGGGFGAAGHGGNGEGVDHNGGSCAAVAGERFANDHDYYNRRRRRRKNQRVAAALARYANEEEQEFAYYEDDDEEADEEDDDDDYDDHDEDDDDDYDDDNNSPGQVNGHHHSSSSTLASNHQLPRHKMLLNDETQASLLDGLSFFGNTHNKGVAEHHTGKGGAGGHIFRKMGGFGSSGASSGNLSLWQVLKFIRPQIGWSLLGVLSSLLMGLCIPISAMIIGDIATIFSTDNPNEIRAGLYSHGLLYTILALFAFAVSFIQVLSFGLAGEKIGINLRLRAFRAILMRDITWFDHKRNNPGSICARLASDVGNVQSITGNRTAVIFQSISILVSTLIFAIYFNIKFSSICVLFVAILLCSTVLQARYAGKLAVANRGFDSQMGKIVLESSANIRTLVSLHQEDYFIGKCEQLLKRDNRSRSLHNHLRLSLESLKYAMTAVSKGSSFYVAARMLLNDEITIDVIFKLIEIILYGLTEASKSLIFISDLQKARRGTQNLYRLVHARSNQCGQQQQQQQPGSHPALAQCEGHIKFNSLRFNYPSRPDACILRSLDLDIKAGKSVALVGRSGCGKSTIVQLLERFYDYSQGEILLDGVDIRKLPFAHLRSQIALVSQEPSLLSYTIGDNIRYGDNSRQVQFDEVVRAAQVANIHQFIMSLPEQYDTKLSESNSLQLSGGQKQRIAIARALVRKAPILIFDEATSALDTKSEQVVQEALERAQVGKTSIIIAHRLSTIKNADGIVVLKEGMVVEQGTHEELLEKRGEYYCLYKTQSKF